MRKLKQKSLINYSYFINLPTFVYVIRFINIINNLLKTTNPLTYDLIVCNTGFLKCLFIRLAKYLVNPTLITKNIYLRGFQQ